MANEDFIVQPSSRPAKKVMLLVNSLHCGGVERDVVAFCKHIDRSRFSPEICTFLPDGVLYDAAAATGVPIRCRHRKWAWDLCFALAFSRYLATASVDLIHVFSHTALTYAAMVRSIWRSRTPTIYLEGTSAITQGWRDKPFRWCLRQVDGFVANSAASRDKLMAEGVAVANITLIPNGHDVQKYENGLRLSRAAIREKLGLSEEHLVILYCGRLLKSKRVCDLIDALPQLSVPRQLLKVLIVGAGEEMEALKQQTAQMGWTEAVNFLGYRQDVLEYLRVADVFAFPSEIEGLPNSVVEAALMQVPIVAADIAGTRAVVSNSAAAKLVPCRNPKLLAVALSETLSNLPASRLAAKSLSAQAMQEFSMEQALQRLHKLYSETIETFGQR